MSMPALIAGPNMYCVIPPKPHMDTDIGNREFNVTGEARSIAELLGAPETAELEFEPPKIDLNPKIAEFA